MTYERSHPRYDPYCNAPHPDYTEPREVTALDGSRQIVDAPLYHCRRMRDHEGKHAAYTYLISRPETWST